MTEAEELCSKVIISTKVFDTKGFTETISNKDIWTGVMVNGDTGYYAQQGGSVYALY